MRREERREIIKGARRIIEEYRQWGEEEIYKWEEGEEKREEGEEEVYEGRGEKKLEGERTQGGERGGGVLRRGRGEELKGLREEVERCKKCELGKWRIKAVFGEGLESAEIMFVGEGPGYEEDHKGEPFIGRAGQLLTKIIEAMGGKREGVYITNIVKCHAMKEGKESEKRGNDRAPLEEEMEECRGYLDKQIEIINPKIIVLLGGSATKGLLRIEEGISRIRGEVKEYKGIKVMPTYHPAALLRNERLKREVWEDMKRVKRYVETGEI
jgi:DNA polymerase